MKPLDEVQDATALQQFYARNPEELSDADLDALVEVHRAERAARAEAAVKKASRKAKKAEG
jgi:predicted GIY-YIG superfamily endonuclease